MGQYAMQFGEPSCGSLKTFTSGYHDLMKSMIVRKRQKTFITRRGLLDTLIAPSKTLDTFPISSTLDLEVHVGTDKGTEDGALASEGLGVSMSRGDAEEGFGRLSKDDGGGHLTEECDLEIAAS